MLVPLLVVSFGAAAQTPREKFAQMLDTLQKTPKDDALRDSIVRLGKELKPAPAVPEDARRELVRGNTALQDASGVEDYARAAKYYENALALAPWWGAAYLSLARAQELQFDYASAKRSLRLYMLTTASTDDARKAQDYLYALEEKQQQADKTKAEYDTKFGWLSGQWSVTRKLLDASGYAVIETDPVVTRTSDEGTRVVLKVDAPTTEHDYHGGGDRASSTRIEGSFRVSYDSSGQVLMEVFGASDLATCPALHGWNEVQYEFGAGRQTITATRDELSPLPRCQPSGYSTVWVFERQ
jgi:tetratricopeptide (TPR) repeat protein